MNKEEVIEWLSSQSVLEIAGLVKDLEEKWGVSASAPVAAVAVAPADGSTIEVRVDGLIVKGIPYNALEIIDIYGKDYLPQPEVGDLKVYDHIDQIRVGDSKRVVDMMWEYGAGTHSKEQYQQLMGRLNTGMLGENPI